MVKIIHHAHDKFFKLAMEEPRVAQEFFAAHLPWPILQQIHLHLMRLENHSFIDEAYKATAADLLFKIPFKNDTAYLYILCEHQTDIDPLMAFRLLAYQVRIMTRHLKQYPNQPLPLVYPLIVYSGEQPWKKPLDLFALFGKQAKLAKKWFQMSVQLLDLQKLPDEAIKQRTWAGLMEFTLKHRKSNFELFLEQVLPWIQTIEQIENNGFSLATAVVKYLLNGIDVQKIELFRKKILDMGGNIMPTLAQLLKQEGRQEGKQEGQTELFLHLLKHRFHTVPTHYLAQINQADGPSLLHWGEKILDAETIEEIFAETD